MTLKPGTFDGTLTAGPNAGKKFSLDGESRLFRVSDDGKKITVAIDKPYVQKITFAGMTQPRVCTSISNQAQLNDSTTVGMAK